MLIGRRNLIFIPAILGAFLLGLSFTTFNKSSAKTSPTPQVISAKTQASQSTVATQSAPVKVTRVIDGDTIEISAIGGPAIGGVSGQKVRFIGIDTPETVDPRVPVACFGKEASDETKSLLEGKSAILEKDISETDKYGRLLRYVFVDGLFVNDYLVRQGFAQVSTYPPDIKYQDQFLAAQKEARDNNRGLWSTCQGNINEPTQSTQPIVSSQPPPGSNCLIKGNISSSGEKIYHLPGQQYYSKTQIDEFKDEHWFCTEEEALAAGWRKSKV